MNNAERASRGAMTYAHAPKDDNDPITNIYDVVCDLMHFADTFSGRLTGFENEPGRERIGLYIVNMAIRHYEAEILEEEEEPKAIDIVRDAIHEAAVIQDAHGDLTVEDADGYHSLDQLHSWLGRIEQLLADES